MTSLQWFLLTSKNSNQRFTYSYGIEKNVTSQTSRYRIKISRIDAEQFPWARTTIIINQQPWIIYYWPYTLTEPSLRKNGLAYYITLVIFKVWIQAVLVFAVLLPCLVRSHTRLYDTHGMNRVMIFRKLITVNHPIYLKSIIYVGKSFPFNPTLLFSKSMC